MKTLQKFCQAFLLAFCFYSCSDPIFKDKESLMSFLQDEKNGYINRKTVNRVDFRLFYRPTDLLVEQELSNHYNKELADSLRHKYRNHIYFNLSISRSNHEVLSSLVNNRNKFSSMVNTLSFNMQEKLKIVTEKGDTIGLANFVYPRMYGLSGESTFLLVFPREEVMEGGRFFKLIIDDLNLATGEHYFQINTKKLINEPRLRF